MNSSYITTIITPLILVVFTKYNTIRYTCNGFELYRNDAFKYCIPFQNAEFK